MRRVLKSPDSSLLPVAEWRASALKVHEANFLLGDAAKEARQEYSSTHRFAIVIALKPPKKLDGIMQHQRVRFVLFASYLLFDGI